MGSSHWFVLTGTRKAADRVQLLVLLRKHACSIERLAVVLDMDYATIEEHLSILRENDLVEPRDRDGVAVYSPTLQARQHWDAITALLGDAPAVAADGPGQLRSRRR